MARLDLLGFDVNNPHTMEDWALSHEQSHVDIRAGIQKKLGENLTSWLLFPVNWKDWDAFAVRHQNTHNDMNAALGIAGTDLTKVNFNDPAAAAAWHQLHFSEHQTAEQLLNI